MDDIDRKLLILIAAEPRIHFRKLAERLGISRQAAHHRMQILTEKGVIKGAIAGISVHYLGAVTVAVFGRSKATSIEKTFERLGESEFTRRALLAGGNFLYVVGFLRNTDELDGFIEFVRRTAEMPEPTVGVYCLDDGLMPYYAVDGLGERKGEFKKLSPLDMRIIAALKDDARRPVADVARSIGASAKTVRRHLDRMLSNGSLDMSVPADLSKAGDLLSIMHVNLRDGAEKGKVGKRLLSRNYFQDQYVVAYGNLPSLIIWVFWSSDIAETRRALKETEEDEDVLSVMLNIALVERIYTTTWRDKLVQAQAPPPEKKKARKRPSRSTA